jgi:hypothetical protein
MCLLQEEVLIMTDNIQHIFETIKDRQPDPVEEIVSALTFPGVDYVFQISREETFNGEWIYRIYNYLLTAFDEISELKYTHLRELMMDAFQVYEQGDMLSLKVKVEELQYHWKPQEFKIKTALREQKNGVNLKAKD